MHKETHRHTHVSAWAQMYIQRHTHTTDDSTCTQVATSAATGTPSGTWWKYTCSNVSWRCILWHNYLSLSIFYVPFCLGLYYYFNAQMSQIFQIKLKVSSHICVISKIWCNLTLCGFLFLCANSRIIQVDSGVRPEACRAGRRTGLSR